MGLSGDALGWAELSSGADDVILVTAEGMAIRFSEDDVRALGDNIVTILTTVRNMTQPEVLALANNAISAIKPQAEIEDISTIRLIKELGDPRVRRGMARLLNMVKALDDQASDGNGARG